MQWGKPDDYGQPTFQLFQNYQISFSTSSNLIRSDNMGISQKYITARHFAKVSIKMWDDLPKKVKFLRE